MKATTRPWAYGGNSSKEIYSTYNGAAICKMVYHDMWPPEWQEANASLIVRAVNSHEALVEALQEAYTYLSFLGDENKLGGIGQQVKLRVSAALKLAEVGE